MHFGREKIFFREILSFVSFSKSHISSSYLIFIRVFRMGEAVSSTLTGDYEIAVLRHGRSKKRWFFLLFNLRAEKNVKKSKRCVIILWLMYLFFFKYSYMHSYIIFINFIIRCSRRTIDLSSVCTLNLWNINSTKRFDVYVLWMFPWIHKDRILLDNWIEIWKRILTYHIQIYIQRMPFT